eukprot:TRINITY_DN7148_c0_g2_i1.p1 TRINITY_DN7148_c0_g2~~TRINITY_DN7148_c0_g2_i1.p1  ORF type:complete len:576 (-),score=141.01 TRINITY_DN7148_c0_g2_i1:230-1957(-)
MLAASTVLLTITQNEKFGRMMHTFSLAVSACFPLVVSLFVLMLLYAIASTDMFGGGPKEDGIELFGTYTNSLTTCFRLFVGEGWHNIMYSTSDATTEASRFWFCSYIFLVGMLGGELFVGVIISLYNDVEQISSPRVFAVLEPVFREFSPEERDTLIQDMLELNAKTRCYNELFAQLIREDAEHPADEDHAVMVSGPDIDAEMLNGSSPNMEWQNVQFLSEDDVDRLLQATQQFFASAEGLQVAKATNYDIITIEQSPTPFARVPSYTEQVLAPQISLLTQRLMSVGRVGGLERSQTDISLQEYEEVVQAWLQELLWFFCKQAMHRFSFVESIPEDMERFECSFQLEAEVLEALPSLSHLGPVLEILGNACGDWMLNNEHTLLAIDELEDLQARKEQLSAYVETLLSALELGSQGKLIAEANAFYHRLEMMGENAAIQPQPRHYAPQDHLGPDEAQTRPPRVDTGFPWFGKAAPVPALAAIPAEPAPAEEAPSLKESPSARRRASSIARAALQEEEDVAELMQHKDWTEEEARAYWREQNKPEKKQSTNVFDASNKALKVKQAARLWERQAKKQD